ALAAIPETDAKRSVRSWNVLLITAWFILLILDLAGTFSDLLETNNLQILAPLLVSIAIFVGLIKYNPSAYLAGAIWLTWSIISTIFESQSFSNSEWNDPYLLGMLVGYLVLTLLCILIMLRIRRMLFPYYTWFYPEKDHHGVYLFS
ncbi:MAG: hypothetical protein AAF551_06905, partial [Bacteroidota bacterium]